MKKQSSFLLATLVALGMFSTAANADIKKGQRAYLKECKKCHGNGTKGAALKTQAGWAEGFADDAAVFKAWHKGTKGEAFANGRRFQRSAADLKDFLYEYGSDSGNVPSCG
ncbi:MAG: c-type cytochrome [Thiovulaceae bacterium]|nr:c-type cytochrome [Sulfurimonadaceae bacterium]